MPLTCRDRWNTAAASARVERAAGASSGDKSGPVANVSLRPGYFRLGGKERGKTGALPDERVIIMQPASIACTCVSVGRLSTTLMAAPMPFFTQNRHNVILNTLPC